MRRPVRQRAMARNARRTGSSGMADTVLKDSDDLVGASACDGTRAGMAPVCRPEAAKKKARGDAGSTGYRDRTQMTRTRRTERVAALTEAARTKRATFPGAHFFLVPSPSPWTDACLRIFYTWPPPSFPDFTVLDPLLLRHRAFDSRDKRSRRPGLRAAGAAGDLRHAVMAYEVTKDLPTRRSRGRNAGWRG